ncbi:hypothetical protein GCM10010470_43670 [Saccharopolyspora taberi]|uniref:Hydantoinase/oxoprolinase n=1 Tax=Saccharopolyspora taberi TaxID=60895 RepID=A0ABN3VGS0_9PSEU
MYLDRAGGAVAVVDANGVRASAAVDTPTSDVAGALRALLRRLPEQLAPTSVSIATSRFSDALADASELAPVAVLRLAHSDRSVLPPLSGWPGRLCSAVRGWSAVLPGGFDLTGRALGDLDLPAVLRFAEDAANRGARGLTVTAVGSPIRAEQEIAVAEAVHHAVPELPVTLSHEIGGLGLLARENTAVLNAASRPLAERVADECRAVVDELLPGAATLFTRHDAAAMNTEYLRRFPLAALEADTAAALRGAAVLAETGDAVVVDLRADRARAGLVDNGFPRRATDAGVPPLSLPLPDVAVADDIGRTVSRLRGAAEPRPVVVTGTPERAARVASALGARCPADGVVAGAVGAAWAQPAAEVDRVVVESDDLDLATAIDRAGEEAMVRAVSAGARPDSVRIAEVRTGSVAYLPGSVYRVQVRATGVAAEVVRP